MKEEEVKDVEKNGVNKENDEKMTWKEDEEVALIRLLISSAFLSSSSSSSSSVQMGSSYNLPLNAIHSLNDLQLSFIFCLVELPDCTKGIFER